jgi:hypothetical protein
MIDEIRSGRVCTSATGSSGSAAPVHFKTGGFFGARAGFMPRSRADKCKLSAGIAGSVRLF